MPLGVGLVSAASSRLTETDQNFATMAARGNALEVQFGLLPTKQGGSVTVKAFGDMLSKDCAAAQATLMAVGATHGLKLSDKPDAKQQAILDKLSKLKGAAFNAAHRKIAIDDHPQDVADFGKYASAGKAPDLLDHAKTRLPVLQECLDDANKIGAK